MNIDIEKVNDALNKAVQHFQAQDDEVLAQGADDQHESDDEDLGDIDLDEV